MRYFIVWLNALLMLPIISCHSDDSSDNTTTTNTVLPNGTWKVSLFSEDGNDETYYFSNYEFSFNSNGTVAATQNGTTINGIWTTGTDDSQNKLYLNFSAIAPLDELNDDWHILQQTDTLLELEDVSGGNGGTDILHFVRQ